METKRRVLYSTGMERGLPRIFEKQDDLYEIERNPPALLFLSLSAMLCSTTQCTCEADMVVYVIFLDNVKASVTLLKSTIKNYFNTVQYFFFHIIFNIVIANYPEIS